jgi:hypothetical protein
MVGRTTLWRELSKLFYVHTTAAVSTAAHSSHLLYTLHITASVSSMSLRWKLSHRWTAVPCKRKCRPVPCCAVHHIKQATCRSELLAVAELCAHEFSSTRLLAKLENGGTTHLLQMMERFMAERAVKELLRRFSQLDDRKQAARVRSIAQHLALVAADCDRVGSCNTSPNLLL